MRSNRFLLAVAVVSVALNLILVGMFLGRLVGPEQILTRMDPTVGMRRMLAGLPQARADELAPYYRAYFSALRPGFREIRSVQEALRDAMLREPLDRAALAGALGAFHDRLSAAQDGANDAFIELAAAMTLEERRQVVAAMRHLPHRGDRPRPPIGRPPPAPWPPPEPDSSAPR